MTPDLLPQLNGLEEEAVYTVQWEGVVGGDSANVSFSVDTTVSGTSWQYLAPACALYI